MTHDAVIVGGGLAGLCCALQLQQRGVSFLLLEASDGVGGRIRTDVVDGFRLDRGFQVFLTSYPEAKRTLDYEALHLRPFLPGALVRYGGKFHLLADPWRRPFAAIRSLFSCPFRQPHLGFDGVPRQAGVIHQPGRRITWPGSGGIPSGRRFGAARSSGLTAAA